MRVTIGSYTYRTTVGVTGGEFMVPLSAENRTGAGVAAGDEVDVGIELDTEPREVTVPPDFARCSTVTRTLDESSTACPTATSAATLCRSRKLSRPRLGSVASPKQLKG